MRQFFQPAEGPSWLRQVLSSIRDALGDIWGSPLRLFQTTTANRPLATDTPLGGLLYDTTVNRPAYSTAAAWVELMPYTAGAALTKVDDTNVTITLGGTPATALLQAVSLTAGWTGQLGVTRGGSGLSAAAVGDIWYGSAANTMSALAGNVTTTKKFLVQTGSGSASAAPVWGTIAAADVPTLNQNTTGSAATLTTARNFSLNGGGITSATVSFDGSGAVVLVPVLGNITPNSVAVGTTQMTGTQLIAAGGCYMEYSSSTAYIYGFNAGFKPIHIQGLNVYLDYGSTNVGTITSTGLTLATSFTYQINGTQVVTARQTGWTAATNTKSRATFDTTTVTTAQLASRVGALIDDLIAHGLIGA